MSEHRSGSYKLATQIGGWGIYAEITLSLSPREREAPLVTAADGGILSCPEYVAAIGFGAAYALESVRNFNKLSVQVEKLGTNPVDTPAIALAFATCHAVYDCLQITSVNAPCFDSASKSIVFPRGAR